MTKMKFLVSVFLLLILCGAALGGAPPGEPARYYVAESTLTITGWKFPGDTIFVDTTGGAGAGTIDSFYVIFTDSASAANGNKHVSGFLTPGDTLYVDTSSGAGGFNWQDSAGEPPFWVDSSKHADSAYNSDSLGHVAASSYLTSESDPVWTSDSADYAMKTWIGPFIDTTTLDTIQNAHKAVEADSAAKALADAAGNTITTTYEVQLNNEAGLYDVLSDVSNFVQDAEVPGLETDATALAAVGDTINARMTKAVTGNTETRVEVTYNSGDSTYDFVVDDMNDDSVWGQIKIGNDSISDHYIYFENGTTDKYFMWDSSLSRFGLSGYLGVTGTIEAYSADVIAQQNMRINSGPSATYGNLYFYEAGASDGAYFRFDTVNNRFEVSHPLGGYFDTAAVVDTVQGVLTEGGYLTNSKFSDSSITLLNATAWRLFYSNATTTAIQELILGGDGTYLKSNGASAAPTWATPGGAGFNWTDSTGFLVGWGGVAKSVVNDTNYFRFEGGADFDTTGGSVSLADDAVDPVVLKDSNVQAQGDIVTIAASSEFGFKTAAELALMEDEDVNTFTELQSWVSDKTLMNEEDVFTIDANWVNEANPWADNEIATSGNWNTAYGWGDHNSMQEVFPYFSRKWFDTLGDAANGRYGDSIKCKYSDSTGAVTDQAIKGNDVDSTSENFVFDAAYETSSAAAANKYLTAAQVHDTAALRLLLTGGALTGAITTNSTFDTVDVAALGATVPKITDDTTTWKAVAAAFDTNYTQITLATILGALDAGGATSLEIPNGTNPTTDACGEMAWDSDDGGIEVYDTVIDASAIIGIYNEAMFTIEQPDNLEDTMVTVFTVTTKRAPHGIKIVSIEARMQDTTHAASYVFRLAEWTGKQNPTFSAWIDTLTITSDSSYTSSATFQDSDIALGNTIRWHGPTTDVPEITVAIGYYIKAGD